MGELYVPWDKSWTIRMGAQDLFNDYDDTVRFLSQQPILSDDLKALKEASEAWLADEPVTVYESGTLYRVLRFAAWKFGIDKQFITSGTLSDRPMVDDPSIINLSQTELLKLDNETSQWASAAVLAGDPERLEKVRPKLQLTYDAVAHWQKRREADLMWLPRRDATIGRQANVFQKMMQDKSPAFVPIQAEDYCFAVQFDYLTPEEGLRRWPSLRGHESDRPKELATAQRQARSGEIVTSRDHRVVQAIAMWGRLMGHEVEFASPGAVNKSWPEFWDFIADTGR